MGANFHELIRILNDMNNSGVPPSKWLVGYAENGKVSVQKEDGDNPSDLAEIIAACLQAGKITYEAASDPIARMAFNPSPAEMKEVRQINRSKKNAGRGEWLSEAIERFHQEKQASSWKDTGSWTGSYEPTLRRFRELISEETRVVEVDGKSVVIYDIPVSEITGTHVREYKTDLRNFPAHFGQADRGPAHAKLTAKDAMKQKKGEPQSLTTTLNKYGFVKTFLNWAHIDMCIPDGARYAGILPTKAVKLNRNQRENGYHAFTQNDLKALFESTEYANGFEAPWQYWIPMIGLYTGARINEIAQLQLTDIVVQDGIRCFSINDDADEDELDGEIDDEVGHKTVKSAASVRLIPIHPEIIKAGFDQFLSEVKDSGAKRLFETLVWHKKAHYGAAPSKFFREYTKLKGVYIERKKVFHSFRRTLNQAIQKAGMHLEHRERLLGHSSSSINDTYYGGQTPLNILNTHLSAYGHGLNHPPYKRPVTLGGLV
jgi:integrase